MLGRYSKTKTFQFNENKRICVDYIYEIIDLTLEHLEKDFLDRYPNSNIIFLPDIVFNADDKDFRISIELDLFVSPLSEIIRKEEDIAEEFFDEFFRRLQEELKKRGCRVIYRGDQG